MNFSHTVKAETVTVAIFPRAAADRQTQVHAAGCAHEAKAESVSEPRPAAPFVHETETVYADDYYFVAACARRP